MIIDIQRIIKISKISHLKKYPIDKPVHNSNYLFHYLILANNLKALKLITFPVDKMNGDNYNGFMLAAKEGNYTILNYLIHKYPKYVYNKNIMNMNFIHYVDVNSTNYIELINENKMLDWVKLLQTYSTKHISPLDILFQDGKYNIIKTIIKTIKSIDYSKYLQQPVTFNLFINKNLKSIYIIKLLDSINKRDLRIFTYVDDMGYSIAFPIVLLNKKELIQYIIKKCGETINHYSPISTSHIFIVSYKIAIKKNNFSNALYILNHIDLTKNMYESDANGNNFIHFILKSRIYNKNGSDKIESILLSKYSLWTKRNIDKVSPLDLITLLDYDKYHKYVKTLDTSIDKKYIESIEDLKWRKYIDKLPKLKINNNVKMIQAPYTHTNMFQARFTDTAIFCFYLREKYKNLYLPIYEEKYKARWNDNFKLPDDMLTRYNNFPWLIVWNSPTNFWVHPKLNELIMNNKNKYKYAFVILSLRLPHDGLHATLILYDFKRKIVERFDPYGNTTVLDPLMDTVLESILTKDTDFSYISPSVYFPVSGFQTLSDENNSINQKMGDFGGYCLAWCFWYVEHRLLNSNTDPKDLVRKTLNRFMNMKIKPMEYIRNYSNMISHYRLRYFKKIGLGERIGSNENLTDDEQEILFRSIIKYNMK